MPKVVVTGSVKELFENAEVKAAASEKLPALRCKLCGQLFVVRGTEVAPDHECTGLTELVVPRPRPTEEEEMDREVSGLPDTSRTPPR